MNKQLPITVITAVLLCSLAGCKDQKTEPPITQTTVNPSTSSSSSAIKNIATDQWLGQWNGPEGTFLKLTGGNGKYEIIIQDLDGPKNYTGINSGNEIQFERKGVMEKIHSTNGTETGMKWLSEKSNCLTINYGEGFCKD